MLLSPVSLDDKYTARSGRVVLNGTQALLVAMLRQRRFDRERGFDTAGFLSGYRGSPLSSVDTEAWRARQPLEDHRIRFQPGINEDLALTSVWGTQQTALDPNATVEGVFGMWYGKGAGLDSCGDALRHAHGAGSSRRGGVLIVSGDDHALKSSSQAYHSEPTFIDMQMPVLYPADIQEMLDYAILGWEMSRYSGCYVGFKVLAEHVNSTAVADVGLDRISVALPEEPGQGNDRWIRWPDPWPHVERRLLGVKLPAALDFARTNGLNRTIVRGARPRLGIVTAGKSYLDLLQAFAALDLTLANAEELGISVYKIGMPWPADPVSLAAFCRGHETILIIEEKRDILETQVRTALYGEDRPPVVLGRHDRHGAPQFPMVGELDSGAILKALAPEIGDWLDPRRQAVLETSLTRTAQAPDISVGPRTPYFCSGCPHNRSTVVPEGSRALAGVGCHFMATGMDRNTETFTQMGGEGVPWIGTAPFTGTKHVFVNLGEGTYYHSGLLAIRAALAANVNITYKILFNDAIAMTGGQPVEGELSVPLIVRQLQAEGVRRIVVVADDTSAYETAGLLPRGVPVSPRDDLDEVQRDLRETPGVTVLIYDQVCATEKRRRRKRGRMAAAPRKIFINERVCEGCGDCSVQSNCLSVVPVETEFGRKREIDQANCNQDYSCVGGFCPSFVAVEGELRKPAPRGLPDIAAPEPKIPALEADTSYDIVIAGVGGTGIVTVGALLGMAAHLEGKSFSIHDRLGMAQKYGAVTSHLRIAADPKVLDSVRIAPANARLLIGGDLRVSAEPSALGLVDPRAGRLIVASEQAVSGEFTRDPDYDFSTSLLSRSLTRWCASDPAFLPARHLARHYLGDEIGANLLLVGVAWQQGLIPMSRAAIERAIEMNGVAVALNNAAFELGRRTAVAPSAVCKPLEAAVPTPPETMTWQALAEHRATFLTAYQNAAYAKRYRALVDEVAEAETRLHGDAGPLTHAVADNFAKLMAYKDEYEVARLFTDGAFARSLAATFEPGARLSFHFAPPVLGTSDGASGHPRKRRFGPWVLPALKILARLKGLRGTPFDPFGYLADRRAERALLLQYEDDIRTLLPRLDADTRDPILALARLPEAIRGYGHVKNASIEAARERRRTFLEQITQGMPGERLREAAE
ncbi:indolepyruvate ferredoxin oxidoreductase family protein [Microbaculum marinum]|uniref:Indolepyruvate ferredoxin oxidoreductase family protein n=1 Tax=Microbaculum marinum TaxID=1764581 RepID=A0AAW9RUD2_9HYPH